MESQDIAVPQPLPQAVEQALVQGNLQTLTTEQRVTLYKQTCESLGLNPLTTPFSYLSLNGKLVLYATRNCTDQLRHLYHVSLDITSREMVDDLYIVTTRATLPDGRHDEKMGVIQVGNLKGEAKANALMKCETKSARRVTLSICGLSLLDEMEVETIPSARVYQDHEMIEQKAIEEHSQDPSDNNPTKDQIDSIFELAKQTDKELRDFGHYLRGLMGLSEDIRLTKKLLLAQMNMRQYDLAWTRYANALKESVEGDESDVPYFDTVEAPQSDATPSEPLPYSEPSDVPTTTEPGEVDKAQLTVEG